MAIGLWIGTASVGQGVDHASAAQPDALPIRVGVTSGDIGIDGVLDEAGWRTAVRVPLPYEVAPGDNVPASVITLCRLTHDTDHLYLACEASDPRPQTIRAYLTNRDAIEGHDRIVLTLDPFADSRRGFQFGVSALGVQYDAVVVQEGATGSSGGRLEGDPSWDAIWDAAGRITSTGYVVEAAIPFRTLRFPETTETQAWGFLISRWRPRTATVELRTTPRDRSSACGLCQGNRLVGLTGVASGGWLQLTPTLTARQTYNRPAFPDGPLIAGTVDRELGLDTRWSPTSSLTLGATLNPDFSQVEADALQLDVNERFALFFPEKRPFFLDSAELFATPMSAVFTRTVVDPDHGARLTASAGHTSLGFLAARDRVNTVVVPGSQFSRIESRPGATTTVIARVRHDFGTSSSAGALVTHRSGDRYANDVVGIDALLRPVPALTARIQAVRSSTLDPGGGHSRPTSEGRDTGVGAQLNVRYEPRDWVMVVESRWREPGLRLDAGFEPQADVRGLSASVRRRFWQGRDAWFERVALGMGLWYDEDFDGQVLSTAKWVGLEYEGPLQSSLRFFVNFDQRERLGDTTARFSSRFLEVDVRPTAGVGVGMTMESGGAIDVSHARPADNLALSPRLVLRLGRRTQLEVSHTRQALSTDRTSILRANGTQLRGVYNFTARAFLRAIVQYRTTRRHAEASDPAHPFERALVRQLIYSYKVNPQTVLFAGYTDDHEGFAEATGRQVPLTERGHTFFLKLGYAWQP